MVCRAADLKDTCSFRQARLTTMALLESVFNHVVLPPSLPGQLDTDIEGIEHNVLTRLIHACDTLRKFASQEDVETWTPLRDSLRVCLDLNRGRLEKESMLENFRRLQPKRVLILFVVEQNAALLVRRHVRYVLQLKGASTETRTKASIVVVE